MFNLILLGDPASGKATQAMHLAKKYNLYDLDMGEELRKLRLKDKGLDVALKKNFDHGKLTPTKIVQDIYKTRIHEIPKNKGILFDGNPKMIGEARYIYKILNTEGRPNKKVLFIYISIPKKEIIKRMLGRRVLLKGKYVRRTDDNLESLRNRIKYYHLNISAVVKFFGSRYTYVKLSGLGSKEQVAKRLNKTIETFLNKN